MIDQFGKNLNVLIVTETGKDWQTFGTWYSFYRNVPEATVTIACHRNKKAPFQFYQWTKRLNIGFFTHRRLSEDPVINQMESVARAKITGGLLVVPALTMALDVLCPKILTVFNKKKAWIDEDVWFLKDPNTQAMMNDHFFEQNFLYNYTEDEAEVSVLCPEANEMKELNHLVSYRKGCGKWIDTLKGCPFSSAAGLASTEMTVNENRIIELWKKMCGLYSAVS